APLPDGPCIGMAGDQVAWAVLGDDQLANFQFDSLGSMLKAWQNALPSVDVGGQLIEYPWELVEQNAAAMCDEFAHGAWREQPCQAGAVAAVGAEEDIWIAPTARIEPYVVADATHRSEERRVGKGGR